MTEDEIVHKAPLSMEFSRQEYWSGLPFPSLGALPDPGIEPRAPALHLHRTWGSSAAALGRGGAQAAELRPLRAVVVSRHCAPELRPATQWFGRGVSLDWPGLYCSSSEVQAGYRPGICLRWCTG